MASRERIMAARLIASLATLVAVRGRSSMGTVLTHQGRLTNGDAVPATRAECSPAISQTEETRNDDSYEACGGRRSWRPWC